MGAILLKAQDTNASKRVQLECTPIADTCTSAYTDQNTHTVLQVCYYMLHTCTCTAFNSQVHVIKNQTVPRVQCIEPKHTHDPCMYSRHTETENIDTWYVQSVLVA